MELFADGHTIVLQGLHLHWHPAAHYCRAVERALGCPAQANAYYTPAGSQGLPVHHDAPPLVVLQIELVDLEGDVPCPAVGPEDAVGRGAEDDRVTVDGVVDGDDVGSL